MKKKMIALVLAAGMTFGMTAAAAEVSLEERVAALEARVAELEVLLGIVVGAEVVTEATAVELPDGMEAFEEAYVLEIGIGTVMKATPDEKGKVVTKLRVGSEVTVLGGSEEWLQIEYKDEIGYVNRSLVESE